MINSLFHLVIGGICPKGHFCLSDTDKINQCPPQTFQNDIGKSSCKSCPAGFYCPNAGIDSYQECPSGRYCPLNTSEPFNCSIGTFNPHKKAKCSSDCLPCTPGEFCNTTGLSATAGNCSAKYYCPPSSTSPTQEPCRKGNYCPAGSSLPTPCDKGYFCDKVLLDTPVHECTEGYVCLYGSIKANPSDGVTGYICPKGHFCPKGSPLETPCSKGTYLDDEGKRYN